MKRDAMCEGNERRSSVFKGPHGNGIYGSEPLAIHKVTVAYNAEELANGVSWLNVERDTFRLCANHAHDLIGDAKSRGYTVRVVRICRCCGLEGLITPDAHPICTRCIPRHWDKHAHGKNASKCREYSRA